MDLPELRITAARDLIELSVGPSSMMLDSAAVEMLIATLATFRATMQPPRSSTLFPGAASLVSDDSIIRVEHAPGVVTVHISHPGVGLVGMNMLPDDAERLIPMLSRAIRSASR